MQILNNLNLNKNSLMFALNHPLASAPATPGVGQMYFDTVTLQPLNWTGAAWTNLATNSPLLNGQNAAFYLSRANHTGTHRDLAEAAAKIFALDRPVLCNQKFCTSSEDGGQLRLAD